MRPPGEIRDALLKAAELLTAERGGATWRDMTERAGCIGALAARRTVENMARPGGPLEPVGSVKRAHSNRWMTMYAPRSGYGTGATEGWALDNVMRAWRR